VAQAVPFEDDTHRFVVESSEDGVAWKIAIDRSAATNASPHTYVEFDHPIRLQFLKVTNVQTPAGGKFAVSDVRAFGIAPGDPPAAVSDLSAKRDTADRRKVTLSWTPSDRATSYLIRYGITKDQMYQHDLVMNGKAKELKLYNLNGQPPYVFRIDALNASGRTMSEARADAP
jgi:xylan 1,4-beta-xylosidase